MLFKESGISLTLSSYGVSPAEEDILSALNQEDFGEFTPEEMCRMVEECYK